MRRILLIFLFLAYSSGKHFAQPANNNCGSATAISLSSSSCTPSSYSTSGATQFLAGRTGSADDDVWYKFVDNASYDRIVVDPTEADGADLEFDPVVQVFSGACRGLSSLSCTNDVVSLSCNYDFCNSNYDCSFQNLAGKSTGETFYFNISSPFTNNGGRAFKLCVSVPTNDNCSNGFFVCDLNGFEETTISGNELSS